MEEELYELLGSLCNDIDGAEDLRESINVFLDGWCEGYLLESSDS